MLHPPGFYYVKKPKRFVILSSDKSSERNLSCFFDIIKPKRMEHLQSEEPFSSDPYFRDTSPRNLLKMTLVLRLPKLQCKWGEGYLFRHYFLTASAGLLSYTCLRSPLSSSFHEVCAMVAKFGTNEPPVGMIKVIIEKSHGEVSPLGQDTIENVS